MNPAALLEKVVLPTVKLVKALEFVFEILPAAVPTYKFNALIFTSVVVLTRTKAPNIVLPFKKPVAVVGLSA